MKEKNKKERNENFSASRKTIYFEQTSIFKTKFRNSIYVILPSHILYRKRKLQCLSAHVDGYDYTWHCLMAVLFTQMHEWHVRKQIVYMMTIITRTDQFLPTPSPPHVSRLTLFNTYPNRHSLTHRNYRKPTGVETGDILQYILINRI